MSAEANHRKAIRLMSKTPTLVTTYDRLGHGDEAITHHQRALDICRSVGYRVG